MRHAAVLNRWLVSIAVVLPWLWPFASGPSPAVMPWLAALAASAILLVALTRPGQWNTAVVTGWLLAALVSSVIGLMQYFGASQAFAPWLNSSGAGEAFANLRQRNQFASLTNIGLVVLLCLPVLAASASPAGAAPTQVANGRNWLLLLAAALLGAGNAASSSRTGLAQLLMLAVLALAWGWLRHPLQRRILLGVGLSYVVATVVLPSLAGLDPTRSGIYGRLQGAEPGCFSRLTLWANVLHLIGEKPLTGWGWRELDYAHFMAKYPGSRFCDILDNAHNLPLHLAVELGVPLALAITGLGTWLVCRARPWRETAPLRQLAWAVLAIILLHSLLEYPLWYGPFQMAFVLCGWLLWAKPAPEVTALGSRANVAVAGTAACLLLVASYAAWDYWRVSQIFVPPERRAAAYMDNTLQKIKSSWLFSRQVEFAELMTTELRADNAASIHRLALDLLHFSPEARVVEKVIESAVMLGQDEVAIDYLARYRTAFPADHALWAKTH